MKRIEREFFTQTEVKRSKFLAHLVPAADFAMVRDRLAKAHPKANHIVWALRRINEYGQIVEDATDDGEPKGCAGRPVLHMMQGIGLVEAALFVVRYFGGIKLGTGGMARAYGEAARSVIGAAELLPWEPTASLLFYIPYRDMGRWEHAVDGIGELAVTRDFDGEGARWRVEGASSRIEALRRKLEASGIVCTDTP
jgi:putative IMPACT (imprinted ancient) family translation regulator